MASVVLACVGHGCSYGDGVFDGIFFAIFAASAIFGLIQIGVVLGKRSK